MDNRGKIWSIDDDQRLMESSHISNDHFARAMGRTENAIKMRRNHLAAKMHQNDPATPLEECVTLMNADFEQASLLLIEWNEKRASLKSFLDTNRKRNAREMSSMLPHLAPPPSSDPHRSRYFAKSAASAIHDDPVPWESSTVESRIDAICKSLREEGGNLASVFNDPQFLPCLIQHYPGFEAYARVVQARNSL